MTSKFLCFYFFVLTFWSLTACSRRNQTNLPSLSRPQMRKDIAYLNKKLEKLYPGLGHYGSQKAYDNHRDLLVAQLPDSLTYRDFFKRIAPLVNSQKDGHLGLYQRKKLTDKNTPYLPFILREVAGKYYVALNGSTDSTLWRGTELLAIEGQPLSELHTLLADNFRGGADADITIFDPATVIDRATFEQPAQYSEGIRHVLVGGVFVVRDEKIVEDARPGRDVRRPRGSPPQPARERIQSNRLHHP